MKRFVALYDIHWGFERKGGHKIPVHDLPALEAVKDFIKDFKPHHVVMGGDSLDARSISHHTTNKPGEVEGLRLVEDAKGLRENLLDFLEKHVSERLIYHIGNHEDWLNDLVKKVPALEGIIEAENLLSLGKRWEVIPLGEASHLGKLWFIHGDQISGGEHAAKAAVTTYERNIRLGHFHTYQTYTKSSPIDNKLPKTGVIVPCLTKKDQGYGEGKPTRWAQGFLWGYVEEKTGLFQDYVSVILNGTFVANGKVYGS